MTNRTTRVLLVLCALLCATAAQAQPLAKTETLTVDNTSGGVSLSTATIGGPAVGTPVMTRCTARLATAQIRYWTDGTAPTTTTGIALEAGDVLVLEGQERIRGFKAIRTTGTSGVLSVDCSQSGATDVKPTGGSGGGGGAVTCADCATEATLSDVKTATEAVATTVSGTNLNVNIDAIGGSPPTDDLTFDLDTGAGEQTRSAIAIAVGASGGAAVITGDTANGLDVDVTRLPALVASDVDIGNVDLELAGTAVSATNPVAVRKASTGAAFDVVDPCSRLAKTYYIVNNATASSNNEIANAVSGEFWYICSINLVGAAAQTFLLAHDDSDSCGSLTAGMNGGTTAATGWSFAANGGIALGNGLGTVMKSATANHYLCYAIGQSVQISGTIAYVSAP